MTYALAALYFLGMILMEDLLAIVMAYPGFERYSTTVRLLAKVSITIAWPAFPLFLILRKTIRALKEVRS